MAKNECVIYDTGLWKYKFSDHLNKGFPHKLIFSIIKNHDPKSNIYGVWIDLGRSLTMFFSKRTRNEQVDEFIKPRSLTAVTNTDGFENVEISHAFKIVKIIRTEHGDIYGVIVNGMTNNQFFHQYQIIIAKKTTARQLPVPCIMIEQLRNELSAAIERSLTGSVEDDDNDNDNNDNDYDNDYESNITEQVEIVNDNETMQN